MEPGYSALVYGGTECQWRRRSQFSECAAAPAVASCDGPRWRMFSATARHAKQMLIENAATKYFSFSGDISGSQKGCQPPAAMALLAANFAFVL